MFDLEIVEGWSGPLDFQLMDGEVPLDLDGKTVALLLTGADNLPVDTTAKLAAGPTGGWVTFTPAEADLSAARSPYRARFEVTSNTQKIYLPTGPPSLWKVNPKT